MQSVRRGPVIEELPDDHEDRRNESSQEPIIEDLDDDQGNTGIESIYEICVSLFMGTLGFFVSLS